MIKPFHIDDSDKYFFIASVFTPILVWWIFIGRKKYSVKGMS
jgi:hypothetical protein